MTKFSIHEHMPNPYVGPKLFWKGPKWTAQNVLDMCQKACVITLN